MNMKIPDAEFHVALYLTTDSFGCLPRPTPDFFFPPADNFLALFPMWILPYLIWNISISLNSNTGKWIWPPQCCLFLQSLRAMDCL